MEKDRFKSKKVKLKKGEFLLYYVDSLDAESLIEKHKEYTTLTQVERDFHQQYQQEKQEPILNKTTVRDLAVDEMDKRIRQAVEKSFNNDDFKDIERKLNLKPVGKQQKLKLHHKFTYLIHLFCSRCMNNENGYANINANLLKTIIGDEYNIAIYTLLRVGLIDTDGAYEIGKSSRLYSLKNKYISAVKSKPCSNVKIKKYIDKTFKLLEAYKKDKFKLLSDRDKFIVRRYDSSLSNLKMTKGYNCENYIFNDKIYDESKPIQKGYYENTYNKYLFLENGPFKINQIDNDNRIYHILTSTPKDLKEYLNIKFSIDIKNSHPLLLNKLLLIYYTNNELFNNIINKDINISNILISNKLEDNHNDSDNPHNILIYNNIEELLKNVPNIPSDVREYIHKTSQGKMWEGLLNACENQGLKADSRGELKANMFAQVFYAKTKTMVYKDYGKVFKTIYPNVYKAINELKPKGAETKLSHIIMSVESELFHQILYRIYKETKYDVVSIHDAIVVLDTPNSEGCTTNEIETIMKDVYNTYGLFPSFSIE